MARERAHQGKVWRMSFDQQLPFGLAGMECLECVWDIFGCWWGVSNHKINADNNQCRPFCCRSHVTMRRGLIRMRFFVHNRVTVNCHPSYLILIIFMQRQFCFVSLFPLFSFLSPLSLGGTTPQRGRRKFLIGRQEKEQRTWWDSLVMCSAQRLTEN